MDSTYPGTRSLQPLPHRGRLSLIQHPHLQLLHRDQNQVRAIESLSIITFHMLATHIQPRRRIQSPMAQATSAAGQCCRRSRAAATSTTSSSATLYVLALISHFAAVFFLGADGCECNLRPSDTFSALTHCLTCSTVCVYLFLLASDSPLQPILLRLLMLEMTNNPLH